MASGKYAEGFPAGNRQYFFFCRVYLYPRNHWSSCQRCYAKAEDRGITIVAEPFEDRKLYHDPKWTAEAIGNILDNAIKYSPFGSTVRVRVMPMEIYTQIEILDQGMGISREEYNQIFHRFYRSSSVAQDEGSGLGLYLAQLILNKEKGYVTVASEKGKGSSFGYSF